MTITADILTFASARPLWEQDLLRRIYTQPDLTPGDLDDVLGLIKKAAGFDGLPDIPDAIPLATDHVLHQPEDGLVVVLASIGDAEHAMQLAGGQVIPFAIEGITIVYGENGSGKSGYCKLLKQICRARRERAEDIVLDNAYVAGSEKTPTVTIRFRVGANDITPLTWQAGNPGPSELSRISVFDSRLAPLYADKEDKIEFLPVGLDVLPRLIKACEDINGRINAEILPIKQGLNSPLPALVDGTPQAAIAALLLEKTPLAKLPTVEMLEGLGSWSPENAEELRRIESELASDPALLAQIARQGAAALSPYLESLVSIETKISDAALTGLAAEIAACRSARDAAQVAATEQFKADPLGSVVGRDPWRQMFVYAAQVYEAAFPDKPFPADGEARICPLCEQSLDDTAFDRIQRFQAFIGNTAQKDAEAKAAVLARRAAEFEKIQIPGAAAIRTALAPYAPAGSPEALLLADIIAWIDAAATRKRDAITAAKSTTPLPAAAALSGDVMIRLTAWREGLVASAVADEAAAQDPNRIKTLKAVQVALNGRKVFHDNLTAILLRRDQLVQLKRLTACMPPRYAQPISAKNTELCKKHLTDDFGRKLRDEMKKLNIDYLPVVVQGRTDKGVNYLGPDLTTSVPARTSNILSEGEFRALSLACFFAEIDIIDGHNGIILDDPVSSLDHKHVQQVASRLIEEAKKRQVIVFTHELSFYYELWHQAAAAEVPTTRHWVKKTEEHGFGTVEADGSPWQAKTTRERLVALDKKLAAIKARNDQTTDIYEQAITDFYTDLRETWERLIEEKLLNGVVGRFQPGVQTQSLSGVEVTDKDYRTVHFAMKKASEFSGHDWAKGRLPRLPQAAEMQTAIDEARAYLKALGGRADATSSARRKAVEAPPTGVTV